MDIIAFELRKLGLKEKEVAIYLAALELGYSSVQKIAKQAGVSRPTAYEIINELLKKGLMRESKRKGLTKGEKNLFSAESPDKLLGLLRVQKREIEEKEREFIRIISALRAKYYLTGQSEIRSFEGAEGIKVLLDDFSQSQTDEIFVLTDSSSSLKDWQHRYPEIKKRLGGLIVKERTRKNFKGTLIIYDKIIYLPASGSPHAILIANKDIAEMLKILV